MHEKTICRAQRREVIGAMALYALTLFVALWGGKHISDVFWRTVLIASPMVPIGLLVWSFARHIRRIDEYQRLIKLENLAISAAVTVGWTMTYGFLEIAGYPRLSMFSVAIVMGLVQGVLTCRAAWWGK